MPSSATNRSRRAKQQAKGRTEALIAAAGAGALASSQGTGAAGSAAQQLAAAAGESAEATAKIAALIALLASARGGVEWLYGVMRAEFPKSDITDEQIREAANLEARREAAFIEALRRRLQRDLPDALRQPDPEAAVDALLEREQRYMEQHDDAAAARVQAFLKRGLVKAQSPEGAFWVLSPLVKNHTPDCQALAAFGWWPWSVLDQINPPVHTGCQCDLLTYDEAVFRGLLDPTVERVDDETARLRAEAIIRQFDLGEAAFWRYEPPLPDESPHELMELQWDRRYAKGTIWGGRFMPRRGGFAPRISIKDIIRKLDGPDIDVVGRGGQRTAKAPDPREIRTPSQGSPEIPDTPGIPEVPDARGQDAPETPSRKRKPTPDAPDRPAAKKSPGAASPVTDTQQAVERSAKDIESRATQYGAAFTPFGFSDKPRSNPDRPSSGGRRVELGDTAEIQLGEREQEILDRVGAKIAAGEELSTTETLDYYNARRTLNHELIHNASAILQDEYMNRPDAFGLEEALTEELAHMVTMEQMLEEGMDSAVETLAANRGSNEVRGVYRSQREGLATVLDYGKVPQGEHRQFLEELSMEHDSTDARIAVLAKRVSEAQGIDIERATDVVRGALFDYGTRRGREDVTLGGSQGRGVLSPPDGTVDPRTGYRFGQEVSVSAPDGDFSGKVVQGRLGADGRPEIAVDPGDGSPWRYPDVDAISSDGEGRSARPEVTPDQPERDAGGMVRPDRPTPGPTDDMPQGEVPGLSPQADALMRGEGSVPLTSEERDLLGMASPALLDELKDGEGPVETTLRRTLNALGIDPYDLNMAELRSHAEVHEGAPQSRVNIAGRGASVCANSRAADFAAHVVLPEMLQEKYPEVAEKLRATSPRWGRRQDEQMPLGLASPDSSDRPTQSEKDSLLDEIEGMASPEYQPGEDHAALVMGSLQQWQNGELGSPEQASALVHAIQTGPEIEGPLFRGQGADAGDPTDRIRSFSHRLEVASDFALKEGRVRQRGSGEMKPRTVIERDTYDTTDLAPGDEWVVTVFTAERAGGLDVNDTHEFLGPDALDAQLDDMVRNVLDYGDMSGWTQPARREMLRTLERDNPEAVDRVLAQMDSEEIRAEREDLLSSDDGGVFKEFIDRLDGEMEGVKEEFSRLVREELDYGGAAEEAAGGGNRYEDEDEVLTDPSRVTGLRRVDVVLARGGDASVTREEIDRRIKAAVENGEYAPSDPNQMTIDGMDSPDTEAVTRALAGDPSRMPPPSPEARAFQDRYDPRGTTSPSPEAREFQDRFDPSGQTRPTTPTERALAGYPDGAVPTTPEGRAFQERYDPRGSTTPPSPEARAFQERYDAGVLAGMDSPGVETPQAQEEAIDVGSDVQKAADLLAAGYRVQVDQPRTVSILLDELNARVQAAIEAGEDAPNFDVCDIYLPGTNIFCAESQGIPRNQMPQLSGVPLPGSRADRELPKNKDGEVDLSELFRQSLQDEGIEVRDAEVPASHLRATQSEMNGAKVAGIANAMKNGVTIEGAPLFVSSDDYIVDGHHRWAANVGVDAEDGELGDVPQEVQQIDLGILDILDRANKFAEEWGIPQAGVEDNRALAQKVLAERGELPEGGMDSPAEDALFGRGTPVANPASGPAMGPGMDSVEVGGTPFRPEDADDPEGFQRKLEDYQRRFAETAEALGIEEMANMEQQGVWDGVPEPSVATDLGDVDMPTALAAAAILGRHYNQDAMAVFQADDNGPGGRFAIEIPEGMSDEEILERITEGMPKGEGASIMDGTAYFYAHDFEEGLAASESLAEALGSSGQVERGTFTLVSDEPYGDITYEQAVAGRQEVADSLGSRWNDEDRNRGPATQPAGSEGTVPQGQGAEPEPVGAPASPPIRGEKADGTLRGVSLPDFSDPSFKELSDEEQAEVVQRALDDIGLGIDVKGFPAPGPVGNAFLEEARKNPPIDRNTGEPVEVRDTETGHAVEVTLKENGDTDKVVFSKERTQLHSKIGGKTIVGEQATEKIRDKTVEEWAAENGMTTQEAEALGVRERRGELTVPQYDQDGNPVYETGVGSLLGSSHPITLKLANEGTAALTDEDKQAIRELAEVARDGKPKAALFLAGGPASGKTSGLRERSYLKPLHSVTLNPDDVKEALPEFDEMVKAGEPGAAALVHEESSRVSKDIQALAQELGLDLVIDGTGNNSLEKFSGKVDAVVAQGYEVDMLAVDIPTDIAVTRAVVRAAGSGRWVPERVIRKTHQSVAGNIRGMINDPRIREFALFDNTGEKTVEIATARNGEVNVVEPGLLDRVMEKADETIERESYNKTIGIMEGLIEALFDDEIDYTGANMTEVPPEKWIHYPASDWTEYLEKGQTLTRREDGYYDAATGEKVTDPLWNEPSPEQDDTESQT